ncbi:hypothetical protein CYK37_20600 [Mesorhizobium loti]|nr:hypothetical protein [Mesorhizobium loti]PLP57526.1 hypothetical protein CYK37_20600 [Mesorhizobium loti]
MPAFKAKYLLFALLPLAAAGCVSAEDQRAADQNKCASFGFEPGTDAFANCMMKQNAQRDEDDQRFLDRLHEREQREKDRKAARRNNDDAIDPRPSYDRDGNPNFDTEGNYQGCNGTGCAVDNPDAD